MEALLAMNADVKFVSLEPLLGPIRALPVCGIDWGMNRVPQRE
ncbi:MAG: hypothetical protein AB9903_16125 [Vulcanimicrobiota bacterium]